MAWLRGAARRGHARHAIPAGDADTAGVGIVGQGNHAAKTSLEPFLRMDGGVSALGQSVVLALAGNHQQPRWQNILGSTAQVLLAAGASDDAPDMLLAGAGASQPASQS